MSLSGVFRHAMANRGSSASNIKRGGYSRSVAGGVSRRGAGAVCGNFFGLIGANRRRRIPMLALWGHQAGRVEAGCVPPRPVSESDGFLRFFDGASGYVAQRYVARRSERRRNAPFFVPRLLIANLTTRRAGSIEGGGWSIGGADRADPPFPLLPIASALQAGRAGRERSCENFPVAIRIEAETALSLSESPSDAGSRARNSHWHMGSGETLHPRGLNSGGNRAESSSDATGRGVVGHVVPDAGLSRTLRLRRNRVNAVAPKGNAA
ncbi:hypothetical protein EV664_105186 [Stakelama pacifica]|uniref:Uncharacterized protein n=1 Tax=Stakelama pacifica TaxID=517720 RepID=A0A4V3BTE0_9SPHN|nr:hypothetical protein EV664_105186 [Stakelama pacifica]